MLYMVQTTFEGMEHDNLTRRFPCYAILMGVTYGDTSDKDYAVGAAKGIMVDLRYAILRPHMTKPLWRPFLG